MALPVRSALKRTLVQNFNSFSILFYYIFSTTYQKIGDLFCPVIFLDFRTVCPDVSKSSLGLNIETKKSNGIGLKLAQT